MKTAEDRERFVELRAAGLSYAKISEALAVSKPTLVSWAKELQVELANARAMRDNPDSEEERRLFYVGITRAREILVLTHSSTRLLAPRR